MNILVTGGAGYVGSVLVPMLLNDGCRVSVLDNLMYGARPLLGVWSHPALTFVLGDIRNAECVESVLANTDAVIHLGAIVGDPACARQSEIAREVNLSATCQLLQLSQNHPIKRFIFASTCSNYGRMPDGQDYMTEESELRPASLYAETKVDAETILLDTTLNSRIDVTVLRFATLYGLAPRVRLDLTVNEFAVELFTKRNLLVYGQQFWRPYVHVHEAARAIRMVLKAPSEKIAGEIFNVGSTNENYRKGDLAELIRAQISGKTQIKYVHKSEDPRDYRVSFDKIERTLGFRTTRSVRDGVREFVSAIKHGVIDEFDNPTYKN